jgi:AraC-like DNA-binding protein
LTGATADGQPLTLNRAPNADLEPWISRVFVLQVDAPADHFLRCALFNDTPYIRVLVDGQWTAATAAGVKPAGQDCYLFGPQTARIAVTVAGPFSAAGLGIRPAAWSAIADAGGATLVNDLAPFSQLGFSAAAFQRAVADSDDRVLWLDRLEQAFRGLLDQLGWPAPDALCELFDRTALIDPDFSIADFCDQHGIGQHRLTRQVRRGFGLTPKGVLRRCRALDLAAQLLGVGDPDEAEDLILRYFDQSHVIREFRHFFGMTPRQFRIADQPIMRLSLESRQARRREAIANPLR